MERYAVVLAGGSGRRLWPLSRLSKPKQFIDIDGNGTLIEKTIKRLEPIFDKEHIIVVGLAEQKESILSTTKGLVSEENILYEPAGRNTTAAIALVAAFLEGKGEATMSIFPSDHFVTKPDVMRDLILEGLDIAEKNNSIITLGITPTFPAERFGYIHTGDLVDNIKNARQVKSFVEKPTREKAKEYLDNGNYFWNAGIFISRTSVMIDNMKKYILPTYNLVKEALSHMAKNDFKSAQIDYSQIENTPIDVSVMEKCEDIIVIHEDFGWSDVGNFSAIHDVMPQDENGNVVLKGNLIADQTHNLTTYSTKTLVAASGVKDLVIIEVDDVIYVCNSKNSEQTKHMAEIVADIGYGNLE